jgi:hypothetical protein
MLLSNLRQAVGYALRREEWVVVLCPTTGAAEKARKALAAVVPEGSFGSGRTFLMPGGIRVSVAVVTDPVFVPEEASFAVMFVGWAGAGENTLAGMNAWRDRASVALEGDASKSETAA